MHLSQQKLAEQSSISAGYVAEMELSRRFPSDTVLESLSDALNVHAFQLLMPTGEAAAFQAFREQHTSYESWAAQLIQAVKDRLPPEVPPVPALED